MKNIIFTTLLITCCCCHLAKAQSEKLSHYNNLIGGMWIADGQWEDGSPLQLEIEYYHGLSGNIIKTKTNGNISETGYVHGLRNEGIVAWNKDEEEIQFWEFDVFGGITSGLSEVIDGIIFYHYNYTMNGQTYELSDAWEKINDDEYQYSVGEYDKEKKIWRSKYLDTTMRRVRD